MATGTYRHHDEQQEPTWAAMMLRRTFLKMLAALGLGPVCVPTVKARPRARMLPLSDTEELADAPYVMLHLGGCGGVAALMVENPLVGSPVLSSQFRKTDGSRFAVSSSPICCACGRRFSPIRDGIRERHTGRAVSVPRANYSVDSMGLAL